MRIAIVSPDYPCERSNAFAFVHARSKLYRKYGNQVEVFFVSNWLLNTAKKHAASNFKNGVVIPNPVDTKLFDYQAPQNRRNGLSVRSLERSIYGLDIGSSI